MSRCKSYFYGHGIVRYMKGKRCEREEGHLNDGIKHEASGSFLDPRQRHVWGRTKGGHA